MNGWNLNELLFCRSFFFGGGLVLRKHGSFTDLLKLNREVLFYLIICRSCRSRDLGYILRRGGLLCSFLSFKIRNNFIACCQVGNHLILLLFITLNFVLIIHQLDVHFMIDIIQGNNTRMIIHGQK